STGLGAVAEPALAGLVQDPLVGLGLPAQTAHVFGFVTALIIVIFLHVVLGEMVPKNLAVAAHTRAALWFAPPLVWFAQVIKPLIVMLNWMANIILRMCGVEPKTEVSSTFTAEEVAAIVARSQAEGVLHDEVGLISGALEFSNIKARDVMVGIDDVVCLPSGVNVADVEDAVAQYGFSRFPVCEENQKITGYLHVKDTLYARSELDRLLPVPAWRVRSIPSAQVDDDLETVLAVMQSSGTHLALVFQIGSHGPVGMVFLEDILEELVGEVRDSMQRN
ncbi:MAG TPA: CNNM domain-containing protein, partial [Beutenbergiaceae bacterium]|nr:CNNM domain-containing protein [Beutenbergiaceae bacterium]